MSAYIRILKSKKRPKIKSVANGMITQKRKTIALKLSANERNGIMFVASFVCIRRNVLGHRVMRNSVQWHSCTEILQSTFANDHILGAFSRFSRLYLLSLSLSLFRFHYILKVEFFSPQTLNAVAISITNSKAIQKLIKSMRSLCR